MGNVAVALRDTEFPVTECPVNMGLVNPVRVFLPLINRQITVVQLQHDQVTGHDVNRADIVSLPAAIAFLRRGQTVV